MSPQPRVPTAEFYITNIALVLFCAAINFFALTPFLPNPNPLTGIEAVIAVLSLVALVAMAMKMLRSHTRFAGSAYAIVVAVGALTILGFAVGESNAAFLVRLSVGLFLLVGVSTAVAAHVAWGGRDKGPHNGPR